MLHTENALEVHINSYIFITVRFQINMIECLKTTSNVSILVFKNLTPRSSTLSSGLMAKEDFTVGVPSALSVYL